MATEPTVLWAQRSSADQDDKNVIFLTVNLPDIQQNDTFVYDLHARGLTFKATTGDPYKGREEKKYAFELEFNKDVAPGMSLKKLTDRFFVATIRKQENSKEFWPRLTKGETPAFVKPDVPKWVDEEDQDKPEDELTAEETETLEKIQKALDADLEKDIDSE